MTRKIWFLQLSIYLCSLVFFVSCNRNKVPSISEFLDEKPQTTPGKTSEVLSASIYFDATLSMQGFVNPGSTDYTRILPYLESVITVSGWSDGKVDFFRFGTHVKPIDREDYLRIAVPDFYEDEDINRQTFIHEVIKYETRKVNDEVIDSGMESTPVEERTEHIKSEEENGSSKAANRLVVIVTDLFQDRGDINPLIAQLKEKYIKNDLEVGLLGLSSRYDGVVFDAGIGDDPIPHGRNILGNPETFRPFYLLVLGRHADIAHYFDCLIERGFSKAETIIFSRYLVSSLVSFEGVSDNSINKKGLNFDDFIGPDLRLKEFSVASGIEKSEISAKLEYIPLPHVMPFDSNTLMGSVAAKHFFENQINEKSPDAEKCLEVTSKFLEEEDSKKLSVNFSLTPRSLPHRDAIYFYAVTVSLSPKIGKYKIPQWCSIWDMGEERDGSRTVNLVNFVRDLWQATIHAHHPKIAKFYFSIKK